VKIKVPRRLVAAWDFCVEWGDVTIYGPVRRIDLIIAVGGIVGVIAGYLMGGWLGAAKNAASYTLGVMIAVWIL
jgi:hydrogenase/urease accessory protein HupE